MATFTFSLESLLEAKKRADDRGLAELELQVSLPITQPIFDNQTLRVGHSTSGYRLCLSGNIYHQIEQMCKHVSSLGYRDVDFKIGDFSDQGHLDFVGLVFDGSSVEFHDFISDVDDDVEVNTRAITGYDKVFGPYDVGFNPIETFTRGIFGYDIRAIIKNRNDGYSDGAIVVSNRNRHIVRDVHQELLSLLREFKDKDFSNPTTAALKQTFAKSKHKELLIYHE